MPFGKVYKEDSDSDYDSESRSDPLDSNCSSIGDSYEPSLTQHYYAYTINVSPKKVLSRHVTWAALSNSEQQATLGSIILAAYRTIGVKLNAEDFRYELTKQGHVHVHGLIKCTHDQIGVFQRLVCKKLGFPKLDPNICCKVVKTIISTCKWEKYMNKQDEIL